MYTIAFNKAVDHVMLYEVGGFWDLNAPGVQDGTNLHACGYVNDPYDPGGETKFGIAKNSHPSTDIKDLTWDEACDIYYNQYWLAGSCDKMPGVVGVLQFDGCVNNGVRHASQMVQRALGVTDDGSIGPVTLAAINAANPVDLCNKICDQRIAFYNDIVNANPSLGRYLNGWLRRVSDMRNFTTNPQANFS